MTNKLKVQVTSELIERATQRDSRHCMIAEAIQTARPDLRNILVDLATIRWSNPRTGKRYICLTPEAAASALVKFDRGESVDPFDLSLEAVQATKRHTNTETRAEARADGRKSPRKQGPSGKGTLTTTGSQPHIAGGAPLPTGHLPGTATTKQRERRERVQQQSPEEPPESSSNVTRSARRYRQYGRRLLAE